MTSHESHFTSVRIPSRSLDSSRVSLRSVRLTSFLSLVALCSLASVDALAGRISEPSRHVDSSSCELYVEKVAALLGAGQRTSLRFFLKVDPSRLDGDVAGVGFYGRKSDVNEVCEGFAVRSNPLCAGVGAWHLYGGSRFVFGSDDYYEVQLEVTDIEGNLFEHEGVFFVQSDVGTRYWLHPESGERNFDFSQDFVEAAVGSECSFLSHRFDLRYIPTVNDSDFPGLATHCM